MKKLFISQPMRGKTDEEILKERKVLIADVYMKTHEEIEVIDSFFESAPAGRIIADAALSTMPP